MEELPNIHVEVDSADVSDGEHGRNINVSGDIGQALFEEGEIVELEGEDWELPKLRVPEKGKSIGNSLASMINMASTKQCDTETFIKTYKVPENCDKAAPPLVNQDIWRVLDKRAQSQDRAVVDIQNLVAAGMIPIIKLAEFVETTNSWQWGSKEVGV